MFKVVVVIGVAITILLTYLFIDGCISTQLAHALATTYSAVVWALAEEELFGQRLTSPYSLSKVPSGAEASYTAH